MTTHDYFQAFVEPYIENVGFVEYANLAISYLQNMNRTDGLIYLPNVEG